MAIFTKIDLKAYKERLELQKANLPLAIVFSDEEKKRIEIIYNELIVICNQAIIKEIEVAHEKV